MYNSGRFSSNAILILFLVTISNHTMAEWINISTNGNGSTIYADPTTIQKLGNHNKDVGSIRLQKSHNRIGR